MSTPASNPSTDSEIAWENEVAGRAYARLDALREKAVRELTDIRRTIATGTHQSRTERDAFATLYEERLAQLLAVEDKLVFGRLDAADGQVLYVGRLGLGDDGDEGRLLIDWRAPVAEPFYRATAANNLGMARRRHMSLEDREVTGLEDDVLDVDATKALGLTELRGEGALMAAVSAKRTGKMGDIVATIQSEQDDIIRDEPRGVLVVQGGPGTGKTAVALHRAAYLLYTQRERYAGSGVLIVGPNRAFMRYIDHVLPSLGETGVVMSTLGDVLPGVSASTSDEGLTAVVKGDVRMADVLRRSLDRYRPKPRRDVTFKHEGVTFKWTKRAIFSARDNALRTNKPHNEARSTFVKTALASMVDAYIKRSGIAIHDTERAELTAEFRRESSMIKEINRAWLPLTPKLVLRALFAMPRRLDKAAVEFSEREKMALWRDHGEPFTVDDVPLLDELAELIGEVDDPTGAPDASRNAEIEYANAVLDNLSEAGVGAFVSAAQLADRHSGGGPMLTMAERAAADRTWAYGHAIVDEAQELSSMAWRMIARRVPSKSMTVVGDTAQTRSAAGARTWDEAFESIVGERFRLRELTVNYRTPGKIMAVADRFAVAQGLSATVAKTVRDGDHDPVWVRTVDVVGASLIVAREAIAIAGVGRVAVIAPQRLHDDICAGLEREHGDVGRGATAVDHKVAVITAAESKGLEFDAVVLLEPAELFETGDRGSSDVFVALTRATSSLHIVSTSALPPGLEVPQVDLSDVNAGS